MKLQLHTMLSEGQREESLMTTQVRLLFTAASVVVLCVSRLEAAPLGTIRGLVLDQSDATVPEVKITLINMTTGQKRLAASDPLGVFLLPSLPVGEYEIL